MQKLSPGSYHKSVPRDHLENVRFRLRLLKRARGDRAFQAGYRALCSRDCLLYINSFVWQFNPRKKGLEVGPFVTWDFQEEAVRVILDHLERDKDLLIEKSREMGASWLCLIVMDWMALFHRWQKFLCISHSEAAVDKPDDPDSLFWKVEFMHTYLPDWLGGKPRKRKLGFKYPLTQNSVTGQATTERSGVGGRAAGIFLDEFSKQKDDFAILGSTADVGSRIFSGTHYGLDTAFYELTQRPDLSRLVMHWSQHPDKNRGLYRCTAGKLDVLDKTYTFPEDFPFVLDGTPTGGPFPGLRSPWYDAECKRRANARDVAMHLDINPSGSVSQFFDPLLIRTLQQTYCTPPLWEGDHCADPETGRLVGVVKNPGGPLKLWCRLDSSGNPPAAEYCMGGDISTGRGRTPSCLSVVNSQTGEKVASYVTYHVNETDLAAIAVGLAWLFKSPGLDGALFCWEQNGPGLNFGKRVLEMGYRHIYYRQAELAAQMGMPKTSDIPGWVATDNNRRLTLEEYRAALASRQFCNRDKEALEECLAFKYTMSGTVEHAGQASPNDPTGARVNHGDRVIADALAWKMARRTVRDAKKKPENERPPLSLAWRRAYHEELERRMETWQ